jgi:hypothetical protein
MPIISFQCPYCNHTGAVTNGILRNPCPVCGGVVNIEVDIPQGSILVDCSYCHGTGRVSSGIVYGPCTVCKGLGKNSFDVPSHSNLVKCKYCSGSGAVSSGIFIQPCSICHGTGFTAPKRLSLKSFQNSSANRAVYTKIPSCFISYGEPDLAFATQLYNSLRELGADAWLYKLDYTPGKRTWKEIIEKRRNYEKFLVICSSESLKRDGILKEIEQQIDEDPEKIVPISRDTIWNSPSFSVQRGANNLKPFLTERNYSDFVTKPFNQALQKLINAIKQ